MEAGKLIELLWANGWSKFQGECSIQAWLKLPDGKTLRIGITDDDVAERPGLWVDVHKHHFGDLKTKPNTCACANCVPDGYYPTCNA